MSLRHCEKLPDCVNSDCVCVFVCIIHHEYPWVEFGKKKSINICFIVLMLFPFRCPSDGLLKEETDLRIEHSVRDESSIEESHKTGLMLENIFRYIVFFVYM